MTTRPLSLHQSCGQGTSRTQLLKTICHEQHHNGISKAFDHARGAQPSHGENLKLHTNFRTSDNSLGSPDFHRSSNIRHAFWSPACGLSNAKAGEMGSEEGGRLGSGREILSAARDVPGNVRGARTVLQTSVSVTIELLSCASDA